MVGTSIDAIQPTDSFPKGNLNRLEEVYGSQLKLCENGQKVTKRLSFLRDGVDFYARKKYDKVADIIGLMDAPSSIEEALIGGALRHESEEVQDDAQSKGLTKKAADYFETAAKLEKTEIPNPEKEYL
jgi:hypothetical protein